MAKKTKIVKVNPKRRRNPTVKKTATRRRRRRNPSLHPAAKAGLGATAGALCGAAGKLGLDQTELSPNAKGGLLVGAGILGGALIGFIDPAFGAGIGAGLAAPGALELYAGLTAEEAPAQTARVYQGMVPVDQIGRVTYPQLGAARTGRAVTDEQLAAMLING